MNYLETFKEQKSYNYPQRTTVQAANCAIADFKSHLISSEFHNDTKIQVADVQRWLDYISTELNRE
jgi:hypothetical protein